MAKSLQTNIIIGGKTTPGFDALGSKLMSLGAIVDQIGGSVREFEKESIEVYKNYETLMLEAEGALTTQYESATQRAKVMSDLEKHVSEWAASSIFHTDDYARAVSEAAHAGWEWQEMLEGIPVAANLAQAGNITLSEGLDDLIKTLNATGIGTENAATLFDQWTMAANSSATTVGELGDALTKMGAVARFADSTEELLAMLAVLADTGTVGESAGTMLRNAMLRVVAPTTKAEDAMSLLGADVDELEDVLKDNSVTKAAKKLKDMGFSAYDASGNLKPMIPIFTEMNEALEGLDEASRNEILAAIFPTRTTSAALAFLQATNGQFDELEENLRNSEGYAARIAKIQTSGLMGSTELLESKLEELKRRVGSLLSDNLEQLQEIGGSILDFVNGLDEPALGALTGAMTAVAGAGPALIGLGIGAKAIAVLAAHPVVAGLLGTAVAIGAIAGYAEEISKINWENTFGDMVLDTEALAQYVEGINSRYDAEVAKVNEWTGALEKAQETYSNFATTLAEELTFDTLTGRELTQKEKTNLEGYGESISKALADSIQNAWTRDFEWTDILFPAGEGTEGDATREFILDLTDSRYQGLLDNAEALSQQLKNALSSALEDGIITEEERDEIINGTLEAMNEIQAAIAARQDRQAYYTELSRAQNVGWESMENYLTQLEAGLEERRKEFDEQAYGEYGQLMDAFDAAIESGALFDVDGNGVKRQVTEADRQRVGDAYWERQNERWQEVLDLYGGFARTAVDTLMHDSRYSEGWDFLTRAMGMAGQRDSNGNLTFQDVDFGALMASEDWSADIVDQVAGALAIGKSELRPLLSAFAGQEGIDTALDWLSNGDTFFREMQDYWGRTPQMQQTEEGALTGDRLLDAMQGVDTVFDTASALAASANRLAELQEKQASIDNEIAERETRMAEKGDWKDWWYNFTSGPQKDYAALHGTDYSSGLYDQRTQVGIDISKEKANAAELQAELDGIEMSVQVDGDTQMLEATIAAEDGQTLMAYVDGDATDLSMSIQDQDGKTLVENVTGDASSLASVINSYDGKTIHVNLVGNKLFATGGRTTEPAIFGEVPGQAEWAIPEAHTQHTADLLNAAREASGFSWNELLSRYGGLNADAGHITVNTTYAPTINAGDATGVAEVLEKDKARLEKLVRDAVKSAMEENRMLDGIAVYA